MTAVGRTVGVVAEWQACCAWGFLRGVNEAHHLVVRTFEDARQACYAGASEIDDPRMAQVVYVGRNPAAIIQLPQVVARLMIAPNCTPKQSLQHSCSAFTCAPE